MRKTRTVFQLDPLERRALASMMAAEVATDPSLSGDTVPPDPPPPPPGGPTGPAKFIDTVPTEPPPPPPGGPSGPA